MSRLVRAALAALSLIGLLWLPAAATPMPAAPLVTITWSADYSGRQPHTAALTGPAAGHMTRLVQTILADPRGWQQDGRLRFVQVSQPTGGQIIFRPIRPYEILDVCHNLFAVACAGASHRPFQGAGSGVVYLSHTLLYDTAFTTVTGTVNHEIGHCLLGGHTATGLMRAGSPDHVAVQRYPAPSDITGAVGLQLS